MNRGDLVMCKYVIDTGLFTQETREILCLVIDYEPDYHGGSSSYTHDGELFVHCEDRRGRALIASTEFDLMGWYDEKLLTLISRVED